MQYTCCELVLRETQIQSAQITDTSNLPDILSPRLTHEPSILSRRLRLAPQPTVTEISKDDPKQRRQHRNYEYYSERIEARPFVF